MHCHRCIRFFVAAACFLVLASGARGDAMKDSTGAQKRAAREMNKRFADLQLRKIYVSDFVDARGERTLPTRFLAATFCELLSDHGKNERILSRGEAHNFLDKNGWSEKDLGNPDALSKFVSALSVDAILSGVLSLKQNLYTIDFTARDVAGKELFHDRFQDRIAPSILWVLVAERSGLDADIPLAGLDGVTQPKCARCPPPDYTQSARKDKLQGTILFSVIITADGKVDHIIVVEGLDPSVDHAAAETIKKWKLEPCHNAAGQIVPALTQIEVVFRMY